ncbi:MAG TPA: hypothetical protein PKN14_01060 [Bacteroidia bacterium]|nr:MAG: hypothetical protein UZ10_BCD003000531 [Bacteroidetes bacterium OLB10]MCE7954719.1 hypothetical protein [Bacteroidetes bacterium CHB6]HNR47813.1 hypothetical protein [Bacteroidia bacterium]HNT82014.1 hypothetical protein [Bacteroidia bacterium]
MDELGIGSRIRHPEFGVGVIINVKPKTYITVFTERGKIEVAKSYQNIEVIDAQPAADDVVSFSEVQKMFTDIIKKYSDMQETVPLHGRWTGGKVVLYPGNPSMKPKEIPMEVFFNKIIMTRDRLRVMEQRINAHDKLSEEDKINLQQYLTRIYGSLTTFNVLFKEDEHHFVGEKGAKES